MTQTEFGDPLRLQVVPYIPGLEVIVHTRVGGIELGHLLKFALTTPVLVTALQTLSSCLAVLHMHAAVQCQHIPESCSQLKCALATNAPRLAMPGYCWNPARTAGFDSAPHST